MEEVNNRYIRDCITMKGKVEVSILFQKLLTVLKKPAVELYERKVHHYELDGIISSFKQFLDDEHENSKLAIWTRLDRLLENLPTANQKTAFRLIQDLRIQADAMSLEEKYAAKMEFFENIETQYSGKKSEKENDNSPLDKHDILVVCALYDPELESFLNLLENVTELIGPDLSSLFGRTYFSGTLKATNNQSLRVAALFQDKPGMVDCCGLTVLAIRYFRPKVVAMTGVCAGRETMSISQGDIIISSEVFTYDTGKVTDQGFMREPLWSSVPDNLIQRVRVSGHNIIEDIAAEIEKTAYIIEKPSFHIGVTACGSPVVDKEGLLEKIAGTHRKVLNLDMESFAILRAIELTDTRIMPLVIKGVMDFSKGKNDAFKRKAAFWSARFLQMFLERQFHSLKGIF